MARHTALRQPTEHVLASLTTDYGGMAQHITAMVLPWLGRHGLLETTLEHRIDPAGRVASRTNMPLE